MAVDILKGEGGLTYQIDGRLYLKETPKEGPAGPYETIFGYGNQSHLVRTIPVDARINYGYRRTDKWTIFGEEKPFVASQMISVSGIVNNPSRSFENENDRLRYQQKISAVFKEGARELKNELELLGAIESGNYIILSPLNGGKFTAPALVYNARGLNWDVPLDRLACFELKRVLMENGDLFIGANVYYMPEVDENTVVVIADDCLASDRSAAASIALIKEQKIKLRHKPLIMVSAASQAGMEGIYKEHRARVIAGCTVYSLNESLYLMRTEEEGYEPGSYFVGDMGKWLGALSESYDDRAPWNQTRREVIGYWRKFAPYLTT